MTRIYACTVGRLYKETIYFVYTIKQSVTCRDEHFGLFLCLPSPLLQVLWLWGLGLAQQTFLSWTPCLLQKMPAASKHSELTGLHVHALDHRFSYTAPLNPSCDCPWNFTLHLWQQCPQFELLSVKCFRTPIWIPDSFCLLKFPALPIIP